MHLGCMKPLLTLAMWIVLPHAVAAVCSGHRANAYFAASLMCSDGAGHLMLRMFEYHL